MASICTKIEKCYYFFFSFTYFYGKAYFGLTEEKGMA